jgi:hypothetical protein
LYAGNYDQTPNGTGIAIGYFAGYNNQGSTGGAGNAIAVGQFAGYSGQQDFAIAIGASAGNTVQSQYAVALGAAAGCTSQGQAAIAIGYNAGADGVTGATGQGDYSVALGSSAGYFGQGSRAIAVGVCAGYSGQAANTVCIGALSGASAAGAVVVGYNSQLAGTTSGIFINGTNAAQSINPGTTAGCFLNPIRGITGQGSTQLALSYNTETKEVLAISTTVQPLGDGTIDLIYDTYVSLYGSTKIPANPLYVGQKMYILNQSGNQTTVSASNGAVNAFLVSGLLANTFAVQNLQGALLVGNTISGVGGWMRFI